MSVVSARGRALDNELIDLTKIRPSEAFSTFGPTDAVLIVTTGTIGFLAKEAFKYFFPGKPTVTEQLRVLSELVDSAGRAKAKSLKVRISTDAKSVWQMPDPIKGMKVLGEGRDTIDLEVVFS